LAAKSSMQKKETRPPYWVYLRKPSKIRREPTTVTRRSSIAGKTSLNGALGLSFRRSKLRITSVPEGGRDQDDFNQGEGLEEKKEDEPNVDFSAAKNFTRGSKQKSDA